MSNPLVVWIHSKSGMQFGLEQEKLRDDLASIGIEIQFVDDSTKAKTLIREHIPRVRAVVQNMRRSKSNSGLIFIDDLHKECHKAACRHIPVWTLSESLLRDRRLMADELRDRFETDLRLDPRSDSGRITLLSWLVDHCYGVNATAIFVRHGEAEHNARKDRKIPDPVLTEKGLRQARCLLARNLPDLIGAECVISSPLKRTVQTSIALLPCEWVGKCGRAPQGLKLDPDLQEAGAVPCNTGSGEELLPWLDEFRDAACPALTVDTSQLVHGWERKEGINEEHNISVRVARFAARVKHAEYGKRADGSCAFVAIAHDKTLQHLLQCKEDKFENCEARGYWQLGNGMWLPIPGLRFQRPRDI